MNGCAGLPNEQGSLVAKQQQAQAKPGVARGRQHVADSCAAIAKRPHAQAGAARDVAGWTGWQDGCPRANKQEAWKGKSGWSPESLDTVGKQGRHRPDLAALCGYVWASGRYFRMLTYAAACDLGATEAKQQVVLGDGADWIKTQAGEHFPDAVKILDWPHLWRNIRAAVRAVQPSKHPARRAWRPRAV
jgi:hypothetical protein